MLLLCLPKTAAAAAVTAAALLLLVVVDNVGAFTTIAASPRPAAAVVGASRASTPVRLWASSSDDDDDDDDDDADTTTTNTVLTKVQVKDEIRADADDALSSVGWSSPLQEAEMTSDDPFVRKIDLSIRAEMGVPLEELLNPAKVVNLERDLFNLRSELAYLTGAAPGGDVRNLDELDEITTEDCDAGGGGDEAEGIRTKIDKKERDLLIERRAVFRGWLKNVFLGQAVLSLGLSWIMVSNPASLFGGFEWFNTNNLDISIRVLGFWWWWLFIIPSLRSRRPRGFEKKALDIAFLASPLVSLVSPALTKDTEIIWAANLAVCVAAYGFAFLTDGDEDGGDNGGGDDEANNRPEWLKFVFKSLDFGSGRERGARN